MVYIRSLVAEIAVVLTVGILSIFASGLYVYFATKSIEGQPSAGILPLS